MPPPPTDVAHPASLQELQVILDVNQNKKSKFHAYQIEILLL